ncbi:MAG TPA: hypothetical protein VFY23_09170 [Candidatus Limnocylindrales bacterium]|nr:hypothetical protein [Candidatus Limnocylindrales bacterium]
MQSTVLAKAEKARRYAGEPDRLRISRLEATFEAGGGDHVLTYGPDGWSCDCEFFGQQRVCQHAEAASRMLAKHLPEDAQLRLVDLLASA